MIAGAVQGHCAPQFDALRRHFADNLASGVDLGASLAITIDGAFVVDLYGGWADRAMTRPWQQDTLTLTYSTTKMMAALCALVLIDRGELDPDASVARYWPEFAAAGKTDVKVRHVLSHTSGVPGWSQEVTMADLCDWEKSTALLAAQAPWWKPGSASGYQMMNHGHLIGEIVRRITGQGLSTFFAQEIAAPLGADFHIGLPVAQKGRLARHTKPTGPMKFNLGMLKLFIPSSTMARTIRNPKQDKDFRQTDLFLAADIGAMNGYGNAHAVARALSVLANGGEVDGIRLLSPATIERVFAVQSHGLDRVLNMPLKWGLGYALPAAPLNKLVMPRSRSFFWGGFGGSMTIIDVDRRMTISFVMNKLVRGIIGGDRIESLLATAYACIAAEQA